MINPQELLTKLPFFKKWMDELLLKYQDKGVPVSSLGFNMLGQVYPPKLLDDTKCIIVDNVPRLPLKELGMPSLGGLDILEFAGITFKNNYFIKRLEAKREDLHAHELVHVVQWNHLGVDDFCLIYAIEMLTYKYMDSPLEKMAQKYQAAFIRGDRFNFEDAIKTELDKSEVPLVRQIKLGKIKGII